MKKFATLTLIILSLFSCVLFSACGDKYKKLNMELVYTDGSVVSKVELVLDSEDSSKATKRLGIKFSGVDNDKIGQVVVSSSPSDVFIVSNEVYSENYFYFDITAVKVADSGTELIVKHLASGKTKSVGLKIDQKAQSLTATTNKYVVAVNGVNEGETKIHMLDSKQLVYLQPSSSTDKVYFKEDTKDKNIPTGVEKITETVDGATYITGFKISSNANTQTKAYKLIPVTKMDGYPDKEYKANAVEIYFSKCLNNENVSLDTDDKHKDDEGTIYETIYLIANDTSADKTNEYCYNNVKFSLKTSLQADGNISDYLNDYSISAQDNSTAIQSSHIGNGQFVVQAVATTSEIETVNFVLTPKNMVGDVEVITKSIKVKGEVRSSTIETKKKGEVINTEETVDIYNYMSNNSNGIKFNFSAISKENITVYNDLSQMRIEIAPEILYLNAQGGEYTNVYDNYGNTISSNTSKLDERYLANQKKLISIFKDNNYLTFTYNSTKQKFVSSPISGNDNLFIKYVETDNLRQEVSLKFDVTAGYEGSFNYLKDIEKTTINLMFDALEGVVDLDVYAANKTVEVGGYTYTTIVGENKEHLLAKNVYINRSAVTDVQKYALVIEKESITGLGGRKLTSDVVFDVDIYYSSSIKNPISLYCGNTLSIENLDNDKYIDIKIDENTSIGEYTIVFSQPDTGFEKYINCYIYKELSADDLTLDFENGDLNDEAFKNYWFEFDAAINDYVKKYTYADYKADYIVYAGKSLNLFANISEDVLNSNIVKNYKYSSGVLDSEFEASTDLLLENYFNNELDSHIPEFSRLNFINNGTILNGKVYYISYTVDIETRCFTNILTEDKTKDKTTSTQITFFVYERIMDGTNIKASLNYPVLEKYMSDYIGAYNKGDSKADLIVSMDKESLWDYVQRDNEYLVNWEHNLDSTTAIEFENKQDKSVVVTFCDKDRGSSYNCNIIAKIKQFNKTIELRSSVLVKKPVLTTELKLTNNLPTFEKISINSSGKKIFEYNLDMRVGDEFTVTAEHINSTSKVTHTGVTLVVANAGGGTVQQAIEIEDNKIKVKSVQSNLHLIVYSTDVLKENVRNYTSGFNNPELYILDVDDRINANIYKGAYFIINLHLEDGATKETAYRVYNLTDFEEMLNSKETGKYYEIMNDINLTGLKTFNNSFSGYIFSERNCTLYDLNLNNTNTNLFKSYSGAIENVNFEIKYNYSNFTGSSNLGLIGELETASTLTNVGATISGNANLSQSVNFGGLVGVNNGYINYNSENVGLTGEITLSGTNVNFGGLVGSNKGTILGTNINTTTFSDEENKVKFTNASSTQGAVCNITINADSLAGSSGSLGGLVGLNTGTISNVYVVGTINAKQYNNVGGVVGSSSVEVNDSAIYTYNNANNEITTAGEENKVLTDVKSGVIVNGKNNVGGIVGADSYGLYYNCWYQILPTTDVAISGNEKVGGIVGFSTHSKLQFCSVMSYKYDYSSNDNYLASLYTNDQKTTNKLSDIVGLNYVAGLVGYVENNNLTLDNISGGITESTIVRNSSVNAVVEATKKEEDKLTGAVGGIYTTDKAAISGFIHSSYFIGKLIGAYTRDTNNQCLDNNRSGVYNYSYSLRYGYDDERKLDSLLLGETKEDDFTIIDSPSLLDYWNNYENINLNYIYVSNGDSTTENQPIFDLVPTSFTVNNKNTGGEELNLYYYDFASSGLDETTLNKLNEQNNIYKIEDYLSFNFAPASKIMVSVMSSDTNVIIVNASNGTIQVLATGSAVLTFTPVLNPDLRKEIKVNVTRSLSNIVITQDGVTKIDSLKLQNGKTKQLQTYSTGSVEYLGVTYSYKSSNEYGLLVSIKWNSGVTVDNNKYYKDTKIISSYIGLNNAIVVSGADSESEYILFLPYGTPLSFTANAVGGDFIVSIQACVDKTLPEGATQISDFAKYENATATLNLKTMRGAYGIAFDYDYAIVYPNDETNLIATVTTDVELNEDEIKELIYSVILSETDVDNYSTYIELISIGEFKDSSNTQIATFKIKISEEFAQADTSNKLKINFKTDYTAVQTVEYTILPQRIDKIEAKSYLKNGTGSSATYEDTDVLKPNSLGMLAIDISPINGYFDYLEIDDITGNEEIKFIQLDDMGGKSLFEVDNPSSSNKGIKLVKVDGKQTIYVSMQIDRKYSSKKHTLRITAHYKDGTVLKTDYKYIDVKMLPIVNVEYQLPNGESKYYETQTTNTTEKVDNLYFAIGTGAQFRITTSNATSPLSYSISAESTFAGSFALVNTHDDFYTLSNTTINNSDLGKKVIIHLQAESMVNNNVETAILNLEFTIVKYVIHSVSITSSNSKGEIYGNFNISSNLELYLKETDISFYNNGGYNNLTYRYDSASTSTNEAIKSINNILKELNENYSEYLILNYGIDNSYRRVTDADNENNKYLSSKTVNGTSVDIATDENLKLKSEDGKTKLLVLDGYYKDSYLAVDMELELDTSTCLWGVQQKVTQTSIDLSKNYLLNFNKAYEEDDYQLIRNEEDFLAMTDGESNRYILGNDLVLENYSPMDVNIAEFDGNGRTITIRSFASFTSETISAGLFAQIYENMIVKNVNVKYLTKRVETVYSFGFAKAKTSNDNDIEKVKDFTVEYADICNDYTVNYTQATFGGLTAINNGIVTNCTVSGTIAMRASTIETNKTSTDGGNYSIAFNIGGLVGENSSTGYITHSSSGLQIFALANIGGLAYKNEGKIVSSAVEDDASIYSYNSNLGNTILVKVGGFVTQNSGSGSISMSHTTLNYSYTKATQTEKEQFKGFMSIKDESAGFVYSNAGKIKNCYVQITKIGAHSNVFCGFVYTNSGSISTCYTNINGGYHSDSNVHMFSGAGTGNLENCIEFVKCDETSYVENQSAGLTTIEHNLISNDGKAVINKLEENGFVFGSTNSAVWKMENGNNIPLLVACEDKVRYTGNIASSGNSYFGLRNIEYKQEQVKNDDGTTSLEWKVKFNDDSYGSASNPFIIANLANWDNRFFDGSTKYYRIVADIEFSSYLNPTTSTISFSGNIQGNDMILSNFKLYLREDVEAIGLFKSLTSADDIAIDNSVRNLTLKITSGWASKADAFGVLSGKAISFNLYNITIDNSSEVVVGGNAVGGVVGYVAGKFDVDGVYTNIGVNSTREISTYRYNIYQGTNNKTTSNLSSVYYAGSVFGIADGYNGQNYKINDGDSAKNRYLSDTYFVINHAIVEDNPILIGDTVGAVCGFVGERVKLINSNVNLTGASFKGYQYSAGLVGENRGVIINAKVSISDNAFDEANYTASGLVGLNIGGLIENVDISVNIIRSGNMSVGGIVNRNIFGTITNASFDGEIFGTVTGAVMASNYNYEIFTKNSGAGAMKDVSNAENVIPKTQVEYKETQTSDAIGFKNITIGSNCLTYFIENIGKFYSYAEKTVGDQTSLKQNNLRAFGLFAGYEYQDESKVSDDIEVYYNTENKIVLNGDDLKNSTIKKGVKVECENNMVKVNNDSELYLIGGEDTTIRTFELNTPYLISIYIVGADVLSFDAWSKTFSKNFVVFGQISGFDATE